ncbi:MAG TPA: threonine synthase [Thermoanaerobaculia bacterium]|jgi:threonine synthase
MEAVTSPTSWAARLHCTRTDETAPLDRPATTSPAGAPWRVDYEIDPARGPAWRDALAAREWSMWRYRELLPPVEEAARIDLGEGATPLVRLRRYFAGDFEAWVKQEAGNPTGSFKDRGLSLAVNRARDLGLPGVQLASAGNAALALAAYAAAAGLGARVALPADTPATIAARCRDYGAEVLTSPGTLVDAAGRLAELADGYFNLSTFREPYRVEGKKTMGLEVAEQLGWRLPDWIVYPTGGGTGIVAMAKAFDELERLGLADARRPRFVVVQMAGCAPLVRAFERGLDAAPPWEDARTRVWGLRVPRSLADFLILQVLRETRGLAVAVDEDRVADACRRAARFEGLLCGPEGGACLLAVEELARRGEVRAGERVVVFQTGHPANYAESAASHVTPS